MSDQLPALATPAEVAEYLRTTTAPLAQDRYRGTGPKFIKDGSRVLYRWSHILEWLETQHISTHRRSDTAAMSDTADRLAQALRDLIREAVQEAVERERAKPPPARVVERPKVPEDFDRCPWCNKKHMRHLMPVKEAQQQLGGISPTTFYALVKDGELSLIKIGRRSFVHSEELDDFLTRKQYDASGRTETAG